MGKGQSTYEAMSTENRADAERAAGYIGCRGAHQREDGRWGPCESEEALRILFRRGAAAYRAHRGEAKRVVLTPDLKKDPGTTCEAGSAMKGRKRLRHQGPMAITTPKRQRVRGIAARDEPKKKRVSFGRLQVKSIRLDKPTAMASKFK